MNELTEALDREISMERASGFRFRKSFRGGGIRQDARPAMIGVGDLSDPMAELDCPGRSALARGSTRSSAGFLGDHLIGKPLGSEGLRARANFRSGPAYFRRAVRSRTPQRLEASIRPIR
jgi:hypothetical protein